MRTAGLPNFRKVWAKLEQDLPKGKYQIEIQNNYSAKDFGGKKFFVISNTNSFGGNNTKLAQVYIGFGLFCIILAFIWSLLHCLKQKKD
jgi:hypothetical protein